MCILREVVKRYGVTCVISYMIGSTRIHSHPFILENVETGAGHKDELQ